MLVMVRMTYHLGQKLLMHDKEEGILLLKRLNGPLEFATCILIEDASLFRGVAYARHPSHSCQEPLNPALTSPPQESLARTQLDVVHYPQEENERMQSAAPKNMMCTSSVMKWNYFCHWK